LPISAGAGGTTPVRFVTAEEARRNPSLVRPGMVFFLDTGGGRGHAGIVAANIKAPLGTLEGETTAGGGRPRGGCGVPAPEAQGLRYGHDGLCQLRLSPHPGISQRRAGDSVAR